MQQIPRYLVVVELMVLFIELVVKTFLMSVLLLETNKVVVMLEKQLSQQQVIYLQNM
jgi:hypothetical protein